ncbi:MAG: DNA alkylation repair protein [Candidatus Micrarchaeota archaeon]
MILPARRGKFLKDVLEIAKSNISEKDDMVQKGTGWMLREAAKLHQKEVFDFLMVHKDAGRTLLRYSTEKSPQSAGKGNEPMPIEIPPLILRQIYWTDAQKISRDIQGPTHSINYLANSCIYKKRAA